jgi:hypothetical protein
MLRHDTNHQRIKPITDACRVNLTQSMDVTIVTVLVLVCRSVDVCLSRSVSRSRKAQTSFVYDQGFL